MMRYSGKTIELRLPSELGNEKLAMALAGAVASRMGFTNGRIEDLKTAVAEACTNAIEHGNQLDGSIKVLVVLTVEPNSLAVDVVDQGVVPIPQATPRPSVSRMVNGEVPSGGMGIFLIQNLMDEVEIKREPSGGNQVRMVIHLKKDKNSRKRRSS